MIGMPNAQSSMPLESLKIVDLAGACWKEKEEKEEMDDKVIM